MQKVFRHCKFGLNDKFDCCDDNDTRVTEWYLGDQKCFTLATDRSQTIDGSVGGLEVIVSQPIRKVHNFNHTVQNGTYLDDLRLEYIDWSDSVDSAAEYYAEGDPYRDPYDDFWLGLLTKSQVQEFSTVQLLRNPEVCSYIYLDTCNTSHWTVYFRSIQRS